MAEHQTQAWVVLWRDIAEAEAPRQQSGSSTRAGGWMHTLLFWIDRSHQRRALGELADLNDYLLEDIGLSQDEALIESKKPFWR